VKDETVTPAQVADALYKELGNWTLSQLGGDGLHDAIWGIYPDYQEMSPEEQNLFRADVHEELYG
jgi:hypothetical protein